MDTLATTVSRQVVADAISIKRGGLSSCKALHIRMFDQ